MRVLLTANAASMIELFNKSNIRLLKEMGAEVDVACNFNEGNTCSDERIEELKKWLKSMDVRYYQIDFDRNSKNISGLWKALKQLTALSIIEDYDFVHCHTPTAAFLSRVVFAEAKTKIIYTAHGFHFFKGAGWKNWCLFFPVEWLCSFFTDLLITINNEDFNFAQKHLHAKRTEYLPGVGLNVEKFAIQLSDSEKKTIRRELGVKSGERMFLSVGEVAPRKNYPLALHALAKLKDKNWRYFICGRGKIQAELEELCRELNIADRVHFLGFCPEIAGLCASADMFLFTSIQEGLPVAVMEAMACRTPILSTRIRGNNDLLCEENMFELNNSDELAEKIETADLSDTIEANFNKVKKFSLEKVDEEMSVFYTDCQKDKEE